MAIPNEGLELMRTCHKCFQDKPDDAFYKRTNGSVVRMCKQCTGAERLVYRNGPKRETVLESHRKSGKKRHARIKDAVFAAYGGYVCACCGEKESKFLTLDHVNNDGAKFRMAIAGHRNASGYTTYRWLAKRGFPAGYQILCMNCNYGKRMNKGVCPHLDQATCNDQSKDVEPSGSKRIAPMLKVVG